MKHLCTELKQGSLTAAWKNTAVELKKSEKHLASVSVASHPLLWFIQSKHLITRALRK